jgi:protein-S-isoprenylcysteine O-methyltransferase Ste14
MPIRQSRRCPENAEHERFFAVLGSAIFFVLAPGIVAGFVPWWIAARGKQAAALEWSAPAVGVVLIAAGAAILLDSFIRFAFQGLGTPATIFPTRHLVITGWYRYVRNPMYVAGITVIIGQSLLLGSWSVLGYDALVWLGSHLFVLAYEEPTLRARYGAEYERFCSSVPRWFPRRSASRQPDVP